MKETTYSNCSKNGEHLFHTIYYFNPTNLLLSLVCRRLCACFFHTCSWEVIPYTLTFISSPQYLIQTTKFTLYKKTKHNHPFHFSPHLFSEKKRGCWKKRFPVKNDWSSPYLSCENTSRASLNPCCVLLLNLFMCSFS